MPISYLDNTPAESHGMQTYVSQYVPVPFHELMMAGQAIQKRGDEAELLRDTFKGNTLALEAIREHEPYKQQYVKKVNDAFQALAEKYKGNFSDPGFMREQRALINDLASDPYLPILKRSVEARKKDIQNMEELRKQGKWAEYNRRTHFLGEKPLDEQGRPVELQFESAYAAEDHAKPVYELFNKIKPSGKEEKYFNLDKMGNIISVKEGYEKVAQDFINIVAKNNVGTFLNSIEGRDFVRMMQSRGVQDPEKLQQMALQYMQGIGTAYIHGKSTSEQDFKYAPKHIMDQALGVGEYAPPAPVQTTEGLTSNNPFALEEGIDFGPTHDKVEIDYDQNTGQSTILGIHYFGTKTVKGQKLEEYVKSPEAKKKYGNVLENIVKNNPQRPNEDRKAYEKRIENLYNASAKKFNTWTPNYTLFSEPGHKKAADEIVLGKVDSDGNWKPGLIGDRNARILGVDGKGVAQTPNQVAEELGYDNVTELVKNSSVVGRVSPDNPLTSSGWVLNVIKKDGTTTNIIVSNPSNEQKKYNEPIHQLFIPKYNPKKESSPVVPYQFNGQTHYFRSVAVDQFVDDGSGNKVLGDRSVVIYETDQNGKILKTKEGKDAIVNPTELLHIHEKGNIFNNEFGRSNQTLTGEYKALGSGQDPDKYYQDEY